MRNLAIVGSHPATRDLAPFDDPAFEVWVFNEAPQADWVKRWDACFQIHKPEVYRSSNNVNNASHWAWLQQHHGKPIYMQAVDPDVPDSKLYPLDAIRCALRLTPELEYFELSAAYAMALAIFLGYERVDIYGMELVSNTEYTYQASCWRSWIYFALGRGIDVRQHCNDGLFSNAKLYGYEGEVQLTRSYFEERARLLDSQWRAADKAYRNGRKAFEHAVDRDEIEKAGRLAVELMETAMSTGALAGALAQAEIYAKHDSLISRQEYEKRAASAQRDGNDKTAPMYALSGKSEYTWNVWHNTRNGNAAAQFRRFVSQQLDAAYDVGAQHGAFTENMQYLQEYDAALQAAGGMRALQTVTGAA